MARGAREAPTDPLLRELRAFGLAYPQAHLKAPWPGHLDLAVGGKIFAHLSVDGEPLRMSCKLPRSAAVALLLPCCEPTGYGLGRSGWVTATFADANVDAAMLKAWIDESYRAVAPKRLAAAAPPFEPGAGAGAGAGAARTTTSSSKSLSKPSSKSSSTPLPKSSAKSRSSPASLPRSKPSSPTRAKAGSKTSSPMPRAKGAPKPPRAIPRPASRPASKPTPKPRATPRRARAARRGPR